MVPRHTPKLYSISSAQQAPAATRACNLLPHCQQRHCR
jgi:hypothetical protein